MPSLRPLIPALVMLGLPVSAAERPESMVDTANYAQLAGSKRITLERFPLPDTGAVDLALESFSVLADDARVIVVTESASVEQALPRIQFYRGHVKGDPQSSVTLTFADGELAGSIRTSGGEYSVRPAPAAERRGAGSSLVRPAAEDPDRPDTPFCSSDPPRAASAASTTNPVPPLAAAVDAGTTLVADIAIDATYEWYERFGSTTAAQNYILNLMAQVSTIYEEQVNVRIEISYLRIFTTPNDPYSDTLNAGLLLDELQAEWTADQGDVARTATHLFSVRPSGGSGVAYIDALCSKSYGYGVSTISASGGSWEKSLVAHELGHNFSSPHTHCYSPEIDRCATASGCYSGSEVQSVGTIMSYCDSSTPDFHPRVEDESIRPAAEAAYPLCMTAESDQPPLPPTGLTLF